MIQVASNCVGCGKCVATCPFGALSLSSHDISDPPVPKIRDGRIAIYALPPFPRGGKNRRGRKGAFF